MAEKWILPDVVDPEDSLYVCVRVPNEQAHRLAFSGALLALSYWFNWQDDPTHHKAVEVSDVWLSIFWDVMSQLDARYQTCPGETLQPLTVIPEMEYDMTICEQLRWNNGVLEGLCCGDWTPIEGMSSESRVNASQQPSDAAPQPLPNGGCQTYHAHFPADQTWQVPTLVSTGDVISISNPSGAGADGGVFGFYYCYDGRTRIAGGCFFPYNPAKVGDPLMTANHMALIAKIGSTWYDLTAGAITVPGGVSGAQVIVQVNDSNITDNSGDYSVDIDVCNNQAGTWSTYLDFRLDPHGFSVIVLDAQDQGIWLGGVGFKYADVLNNTGAGFRRVIIHRAGLAAIHLTGLTMWYTYANGTDFDASHQNSFMETFPGPVVWGSTIHSSPVPNGTNVQVGYLRDQTAVTEIELGLTSAAQNSGIGGLDGNAIITGMTISGKATNPFA